MFKLFPQLNETAVFDTFSKDTGLLLYSMLRWILSDNPPDSFVDGGETFFYLSKSYFISSPFFTKPTVNESFKAMKDCELFSRLIIKSGKRYYYSFKWDNVLPYIDSKDWIDRIKEIKEKEMSGLIEIDDKKKYPNEAKEIVDRILDTYPSVFRTRKNEDTRTFQSCLKFVSDLHAGIVTKSRIYPMCNERKDFNVEGWKGKVDAVKLDWNATERIIFNAIENYKFMFSSEYMPFNKQYLPSDLSKWFYNYMTKESYFIRSLNPPMKSVKYLSEKKADTIFDSLEPEVQEAGENLLDLNPSMSSGLYWENVKKMACWAKALKDCETSSGYWFRSPSGLINRYTDFLKDNGISVAINTIDIGRTDSQNTPWKRFLEKAVGKYGLNPRLYSCGCADDVYALYDRLEKLDIPAF